MDDIISSLPDEVLCHILSFLSTQEAGATSVISKRWRPLWTWVPVLDYDDQIYLRNNKPAYCFERFVSATILARDEHQPITKFRLKYGVFASRVSRADVSHATHARRSNTDVNVWVNTAIRRGIQNLHIDIFPRNQMISLSCCILSCKTLVVLKLEGLSLSVSSSVDLPSLKSLHLSRVKFVTPQHLLDLLYGCPMLEDLKATRLHYGVDMCFLEEEFKFLSKLARADLRDVGWSDTVLLNTICNVEFLIIEEYQYVYEIPEFPHLRHLDLFFHSHSWESVVSMLENCPKLLSFKLDLRRSSEADDVLPDPPFIVPESLKECYLRYYQGTQCDLKFAKYIMQNSASLQSMKIHSFSLDPVAQLEREMEFALCPRRSASCQLSFE